MDAPRNHRGILVATVLVLLVSACGPQESPTDTDGTWVGTITTEGNVTTVINESGSVWGGTARLVEEASIGVESGDDAYMLGVVRGVLATDGEIFVLDTQVPVLRVYDLTGSHVRDIGQEGDGPGEFRRPDSLVMGGDGRIYVRDWQTNRIMIFWPDGREAGTISLPGGISSSLKMVMTAAGALYNYERLAADEPANERSWGMVPRSEDAEGAAAPIALPDFGFEAWRLTASMNGGRFSISFSTGVPFAPSVVWALAPSGAMVAGVSNDYSFEVQHPDGSTTKSVKFWTPVPVDPEEAAWRRRGAFATMRRSDPEWAWMGNDIPAFKPAFRQLLPDHTGRVWAIRRGPGRHVPGECTENPTPETRRQTPCWTSTSTWEAFAEDGHFLGEIDVPEGVSTSPPPYIRGDTFLAVVSDEAGTIMVKRYRLMLPGER